MGSPYRGEWGGTVHLGVSEEPVARARCWWLCQVNLPLPDSWECLHIKVIIDVYLYGDRFPANVSEMRLRPGQLSLILRQAPPGLVVGDVGTLARLRGWRPCSR